MNVSKRLLLVPMLLSNDGKAIAGPARATRYAANGAVLSAVCGSAVSTRL